MSSTIVPTHTPADILAQALIDGEVLTDGGTWSVTVGFLLDDSDVAAVYDTVGRKDGRHMYKSGASSDVTGRTVEHPGFQIRVRGVTQNSAQEKLKDVSEYLDTIRQQTIWIGSSVYHLVAVSKTSTALSLGRTEETRFHEFTLNGTMTITLSAATTTTSSP